MLSGAKHPAASMLVELQSIPKASSALTFN